MKSWKIRTHLFLLIGTLLASAGYTPFFVSLAVLDLIAAVLLWTLVREPQPVSMQKT